MVRLAGAALLLCSACRFGFGTDTTADADLMMGDAQSDATADAPPGSVTKTFGEEPSADHRNVTVDTHISGKLAPDERGFNYGGETEIDVDDNGIPLLRFDVSAIAPGATILSATLRVTLVPSTHDVITIHRVAEQWTEGNLSGSAGFANWTMRTNGAAWAVVGAGMPGSSEPASHGQIAADASGTLTVSISSPLVSSWVESPATNYGISLSVTNADNTRIASSEASMASTRPLLTITYFP